jgi:hypothetical protein
LRLLIGASHFKAGLGPWSLSLSIFDDFIVWFGRHDRARAVEILVKDLKVFASFNEELFKEITQLLTLENFRYGSCSFGIKMFAALGRCGCDCALMLFEQAK